MALSAASCERMAAASRSRNTVVAVAHVRRLFPASQWVRSILEAGLLGKARRVDWSEGSPYDWPLVSPSLFDATASGGGVLADTGPHVFDLLLWWLGADFSVEEYRDSSLGGAESECEGRLTLGGAEIHFAFSRLRPLRNRCVLEGCEGTLEVGLDLEAPYALRAPDGHVVEAGVVAAVPPAQDQWERLFSEQLRNFAAATRSREAVYATAEDGRVSVALIEACYAARGALALPWRSWGDT